MYLGLSKMQRLYPIPRGSRYPGRAASSTCRHRRVVAVVYRNVVSVLVQANWIWANLKCER